MSTPIFYIQSGSLSFADKLIFDALEFYLYPKDKICFVGKNGAGKSSLLKIITGEYELDSGKIYKDPSVKIAYLKQDTELDNHQTVMNYVYEGLNDRENTYIADTIIGKLGLDPEAKIHELSGGVKRRVSLAHTLSGLPDILLLDEPTNHLDIQSIEWLESFISNFSGSLVLISHDRAFLSNITNKIWWLDRGLLRKSNEGFKNFENWQESIISLEENQLRKLDKKLSEENEWLARGVTARRKRNQKRLASLKLLRTEMQNFKAHLAISKAKLSMSLEKDVTKSKFIIEAENICFSYQNKPIIKDFNIRITKGEKIGIIGPNGSGKSTLIQLLMKQILPSSGKVKYASNLEITYLDQQRLEIQPHQSIASFLCPTGGDTVFLQNQEMHVAGYLKKFLFDPKMKDAKISTLSGGERNRLLLARSLISPGNLMILDEPTNDLDVDTLDLLLEILADYDGTLIVVSHDRDFLDKLVIKSLVFTEDGIEEIVGSIFDKIAPSSCKNEFNNKHDQALLSVNKSLSRAPKSNKMTYKDARLIENMPATIELLENELKVLEGKLDNPDLFLESPEKFYQITNLLEGKREELDKFLELWIKLEEKYKST